MHPLVQLAKQAIETYVREGKTVKPPTNLSPEMKRQAGTFVSLHEASGNLRGCIGTVGATQRNIAEEVIQNAISAATRDPRFSPVRPAELEGLDYKVDVLSDPEPITGLGALDPKRYGVIVESGLRRGLLLPDLEGVDTVEYQVEIACRKAGISLTEPKEMYRFEVKRYT